jgi:hypothetical protein
VVTSQKPAHGDLFAVGKWVQIETSSTGIHKIDFNWLKSAGFTHPENVRLYGSRNIVISRWNTSDKENSPVQIPVYKTREAGGNEALLFYVEGDVHWQYDAETGHYYHTRNQAARGKSWFYLTEDTGLELSVPVADPIMGKPDAIVTNCDDFELWEEENINLIESGSAWFTSLVGGGQSLKKTFTFQDRIDNVPVEVTVRGAGRSTIPSRLELTINNLASGSILFRPVQPATETDFAVIDSVRVGPVLVGNDLSISLKYNGGSADQSWLDFVTVQYRRNLNYRGSPLVFRDGKTLGSGKILEYRILGGVAGLQLWEITNPLSPQRISYQLNGSQLSFSCSNDGLRTFLLFDPGGPFPGVNKKGEVKNFSLTENSVSQYLIVAPADFLPQAERLAKFHRQVSGLTVSVVSVEAIFHGFSGGYPDISAMRNYFRFSYQQKPASDGTGLKYLLLFGKGTCDPVHEPGDENPNWIPTWQSANSVNPVNSYLSDDFFGRLDPGEGEETGDLDLCIGRIPAVNLAEATIAVDKIVHYHDAVTLGDWRNNICFIGDDEDNNLHVSDSEKLANLLNNNHPEYNTSKIYFDAYPQVVTPEERYPEVTDAIRRSVQRGNLILNYIGHASEDGLAHERVLTNKDIDTWTNKDRLPLFVTATCEFSRWDMAIKRSAGEHLLFHPAGGSVALFSTTRLVYSASNFELNKSFFTHLLDKNEQGLFLRLGDLIRNIKYENGASINTAKFCLVGDPALRLNYPEYQTGNTEINQQPVEQFGGVLSPSQMVTISGEVLDGKGIKMEQFNGMLTAQVMDQPGKVATIGNGGLPPFSYKLQESTLFNGHVPVKNGHFSYTFVVPKDVNFNKDAGLIRYYFTNGTSDGNGSIANIHFNGTEVVPTNDNSGPAIRLYLENESFREGGTVSANPLLKVYLSDESGINTSGIGIGHDITLELDGLASSRVNLNGYYRSDPATWKSGIVQYALSSLGKGKHTLTFKVWDSLNNSSLLRVTFWVSDELRFTNLFNYPNPFSGLTRFVISHNRYDEPMQVDLEVMDFMGKLLHRDQKLLPSRGYEVADLIWNPLNSGAIPADGIYPYRITLTDQTGQKKSKTGKLLFKK